MDLGLSDRVVAITGAGAGIGLEIARAYLAEGARVVGADLDPSGLHALGDASRVLVLELDLRTPDGGHRLAQAALERFGRIDVLVNNAGAAAVREGFLGVTDAQWQATLELNLMGYVRATRAVLPHMLKRGSGSLIHVASEAGRMPNPRLPDYSVSKAAVLMLSKVLSLELTPKGIRSNAILPGFIRTPIYDRPGGLADALAAEYGLEREPALERFVAESGIPAGRLGTPQEVAAIAVFLASDAAAFVSGANVAADGGVTPVV